MRPRRRGGFAAAASAASLICLVLLSHALAEAAAAGDAPPTQRDKLHPHSTAVSVLPAGDELVQYAISCPASETDHQLFLPARTDSAETCSVATNHEAWSSSPQTRKRRSNLTPRALANVRDLAAMSRPRKQRGSGIEDTKALAPLRRDLATALAEGDVAADDIRMLELGQLLANGYHATATETENDQLEREEAHHLCSTESVFALLSNGSFCKLDLSQPSGVEWCNQYDPLVVTQSDQSQQGVAIGFEDGAVYLDKGGTFAALDMKVNDFPQHYETEDMHFSRSTTHCHEVVGLHSGRIFKGCKASTGDARLPDEEEDTFSLWLTKHTVLGQSLDTSEMLLNLSWTQYVLMDRVLTNTDLQHDAWYHGRVFYSTNVTHLAFGSIPGTPLWEDSFEAPVVAILQLRGGRLYQLPHHHFFFVSSGKDSNKPLIRLVEAAHLVDPEKNHGVLSPVTVISMPPPDVSVPLIAHMDGEDEGVDFQIHRAPRHSVNSLQGMCERGPSCRQPLVALMLEAKKAAEGRRRLAEQIAPHPSPPPSPSQPRLGPAALLTFWGPLLIVAVLGGVFVVYVRLQRRDQNTTWMQELQLYRANRSHRPRVAAAEPYEGLTLHLDRRLGEGADNTIVFEGTFKKEAVAIKVIGLQGLASREADLLRSSHNQHVVRYHLDFERENLKFIVMERCVGNLHTLARCKEDGALGQLSKLDITRGMLEGLSYLHTHGIVHRDVKPSNVLIAVRIGRHVPVIADLGLSRQLQHDMSLRTAAVGTRGWVAPEVEGSESPVKITRAADVYSAGRVVAFLYDKAFKIADDPLPYAETEKLRKELIKRMTSREPLQRPSAKESLAHKFCRHGEEKALADELMLSMMEADRTPTMKEAELADNLRIDLVNRLGTGAANTAVFAGRRGETPVAVKCITAQNVVAGREIQQLHDAHNHNIIRYYQHHTVHKVMCIVLEKCLCSLSDLVPGSARSPRVAPSVRLSRHAIVKGMLQGLAYLHRHRTVHCDIKPSNVLIAVRHGQHVPVMADFGLSRHVDPDTSCHTRTVGTPGWLAPEVDHPGEVHVTIAVDVYSAGKVIDFLYERDDIKLKRDECAYVANTEVRRDLISRMTRHSPEERPDIAACLHHPFFWNLGDVQQHVKELNDELQAIKRDAGDKRVSEVGRAEQKKRLDHARQQLHPLEAAWRACFEDPVLKDNLLVPKKGAKYCSDDILDVVRVLRNKVEHVKEVPAPVLEPREVTRENLVIFFLERFPTLLVHVYALKELLAAEQL